MMPIPFFRRRILPWTLALLGLLAPAFTSRAVFNERDLARTLHVLRFELAKAYGQQEKTSAYYRQQEYRQHAELLRLIDSCNELSLMLYSQKQDFTFDLTYALQQVTDQYRHFTESRAPYDNIIQHLDVEIDRYGRLVAALKLLPPELVEIPDSLGPGMLDSLALALKGHIIPAAPVSNGIFGFIRKNVSQEDTVAREDFYLADEALEDRDSCLFYADRLLASFTEARDHLVQDNQHYESADRRLKEAYEYAQERYALVQKKIFVDGQGSFFRILSRWKWYSTRAWRDAVDKYGSSLFSETKSEWSGPIVIGFSFIILFYLAVAILLSNLIIRLALRKVKYFRTEGFRKRKFTLLMFAAVLIFVLALLLLRPLFASAHFFTMASTLVLEYALLLLAILLSMLVRYGGDQFSGGMRLYTPVMLLGMLVIAFRIIFIPNSLITLVFPPLLLLFCCWQVRAIRRNGYSVPKVDRTFSQISLVVTAIALVMAIAGYVLLGLQFYIWWIFQFTAIQLILAIDFLLKKYWRSAVDKRARAYRIKNQNLTTVDRGSTIEVTWLYDFVEMVVLPLVSILSIPFCFFMAAKVFDLTEVCKTVFYHPFLNYKLIQLSLSKILTGVALFFIFRYIAYAAKAFYRIFKLHGEMAKSETGLVRRADVNLTLANNLIGILVWGSYVIATILLLKIPTSSLSVVTAGLAAGLGFAMKDILNNFFYGVQLMSGRLRTGDYIECDGIRGVVDNINYQSTQIVAIDGSQIVFPNSALFAKNFKNLTRNHSYEYIAIPVGVAYGTDIDQVRKVLLSALRPLGRRDKFGRRIVDEKYGVKVTLNGFGESSVDLLVKQYVLVEERYNYISSANEIIYNALNKNGIQIPFPQQDVYIKEAPGTTRPE